MEEGADSTMPSYFTVAILHARDTSVLPPYAFTSLSRL